MTDARQVGGHPTRMFALRSRLTEIRRIICLMSAENGEILATRAADARECAGPFP